MYNHCTSQARTLPHNIISRAGRNTLNGATGHLSICSSVYYCIITYKEQQTVSAKHKLKGLVQIKNRPDC